MPDIIKIPNAIKLQGLPDDTCFTTFAELLKALVEFMSLEIPASITNVVVSNVQPLDDQRNAVWFRMSNGGDFIGIYIFSGGTWIQIYPVPGVQFLRIAGDSTLPPAGYVLGNDPSLGLTAAQIAHIEGQWLLDPTLTFWVIFDVCRIPI